MISGGTKLKHRARRSRKGESCRETATLSFTGTTTEFVPLESGLNESVLPLVAVGDVSLPPLGAAVCAMTVEGESSVIRTVALVMGVTK